ncbi:Gfo/Idh/MocA family oxidoreductase [Chloroflexota bacterium]
MVIGNDHLLRGARKDRGQLEVLPLSDRPTPFEVKGWGRQALSFLVEELVKGIRGDKKASPNFYDGMKCQEVMDAVRRSADERRWVKLSGDK